MMNPLLTASSLPYGAPDFDRIKPEHYLPAFRESIKTAKAEIDRIADCPEGPSFENTIEALEFSGEALDKVSGIFYNILEADSNDALQQIAEEISPELTEFSMYISMNTKLFERVRTIYDNRMSLNLRRDQELLLEETYRSFTRKGAGLSEDDRKLYGDYMKELSLLSLQFGKNVLDSTNAFILNIMDSDELEGLPDYALEQAKEAAEEREMKGWVFTLDRPSYGPFMQYCANPLLRKRMYMEYNTRATGEKSDNRKIVKRIAELRMLVAGLLGYSTWADYVLEENMAKTTDIVLKFLDGLITPSIPFAKDELSKVTLYAFANGFAEKAGKCGLPSDKLMPWDLTYWSERYKEAEFSFNESLLKPYFKLENCINAVFDLANRLYDIRFEERKDIPVYHKDVKVFDVRDADGTHLALFYADFFPRASKRGGAWMTEFRGCRSHDGKEERPLVSIVTNFTKPTSTVPSLLTHDELTTFLHEFGHSLHGIFAKGRYPSQCGTNVARDFVELPSQIMENWAFEPEYLNTFAKDYRTGEIIPEDLISKIVSSKNFLAGYYQVRQLDFGELDMAWHTIHKLPDEDTVSFEKKCLSPYSVLPAVPGTCISTSFGHIFSGGYSAGYYSYKWAEVLEADAFSLFIEKGIFDKETAESFRKNILSKGSSEDPAVLYRRFRGHDPQISALMDKLGLTHR